MTTVRLAVIVMVLASAAPAPAALTIPFSPAGCATRASHVVVTDGAGKVLESWVGDLKPGDTVPIGKFKLKLEQDLKDGAWRRLQEVAEKDRPAKVTGGRLLVFLATDRWGYDGTAPIDGWGPADEFGKGFERSVGWCEGGFVFGEDYLGWSTTSRIGLVGFGTEAQVKKDVLAVIASLDKKFGKAKAEKDQAAKVEQLVWFIDKETRLAGPAFGELATCGEAGLVAITKDNRGVDDPGTVAHVVRAARRFGPAAKDPLMRYVTVAFRGVRFYADRPGFPRDIHPEMWAEVETLRRLLGASEVYADLTPAERATFTEVADYFANRPVLGTYGEKGDRVPDKIAAVLAGLRK